MVLKCGWSLRPPVVFWNAGRHRLLKVIFPLGLLIFGCGDAADELPPTFNDHRPAPPHLEEATAHTGLNFIHETAASGSLYMPEMMSSGGALLDIDADGDLDLYLLQGGGVLSDSTHASDQRSDRLYRNDLEQGAGLQFTDITAEAGVGSIQGFGMGAAVGDVNGDGLADIFLTRLGPNALLKNLGGGRFEDITQQAGVRAETTLWSVPAVFFDYDRDGILDLFVGNYVAFSTTTHHPCYSKSGSLDYCGPSAYAPTQDRLYHNLGDGTFDDVTLAAGLGNHPGSALGAVASDFDGDGWLDLYVANDERANFLWRNLGDGQFEEIAELAGCAVNMQGQPEASMGIGVGDMDGDGDDDLLIAHLRGESNTLYSNDGKALFRDATISTGLGGPSWPYTGFGIGLLDLEHDGDLDFFVANGAVRILNELVAAGDSYPLHQGNQLFLNQGSNRYQELTASQEPALVTSEVSRSVLVGDLDNDGDHDLVVLNNNGPARILINRNEGTNSWVGVRAVEPTTGGDALGARVFVLASDGREHQARIATDGSYAGASDPRSLIGLGQAHGSVRIRIQWPDGAAESWHGLETGHYHELQKGSGHQEVR